MYIGAFLNNVRNTMNIFTLKNYSQNIILPTTIIRATYEIIDMVLKAISPMKKTYNLTVYHLDVECLISV